MGDEVDNSTPTENKETNEPVTTTVAVNGDHNGDSHADIVTTDNDDVAESNDETTNNESSDDTMPAKKPVESGGEDEPKNGCNDSADDAEMSEDIVDSQDEDMLEKMDEVEGDTNEALLEAPDEEPVEMTKPMNNDVVHSLTDTEDDSEGEAVVSKHNASIDDEASSQSASKVQEINDDDPIPLDDSEDDEATNASKRSRNDEPVEKSVEEPQAKKLKTTTTTTNGSVGSPDVEEILSDKEDVIVIEDGKNNDLLSPRRSGRQRSTVKVRDFASYDDDDVQEVAPDPLSVQKQKSLDSIKLAASGASLDIQQQIRRQTEQFQKKQQESLTIIDTTTLLANRNNNKSLLISQQSSPKAPTPNMYNINMRATISPVTPKSTAPVPPLLPVTPTSSNTSTQQLLPDLSDDMFVLEAPSFIVPYIYEKPSSDNLRDTVAKIEAMLEEIRKKRKALKGEESNEESSQAEDSLLVAEPSDDVKTETASKKSKKKSKRYADGDDDSWDENDASTDDEASDSENRTKVLIKDVQDDIDSIKEHIITPNTGTKTSTAAQDPTKKSTNYFESPIGKFFMDIGINAVQQYVQTDLLRQLKRKKAREEKANTPSASTMTAINSLMKNLEVSKENNKPFKFAIKRCEYCSYKTESALAMAYHYETPHLVGMVYKCNFCEYESRPAHEILYHMEALHNIKGRIEKTLSYHQCPNCTFEDNGKSKLARHALACVKKFKPETNLAPYDWDPPGKLRLQSKHGLIGTANAYQALAAQQAAQRQALASATAAAMTASARINPAALANQRKRLSASAQAIGKPMTSVLQGQMAGMKNMSQNMRWQLENSNRAASFNQQVLQQMARGGGNISMAGSLSIQQSTAPGPKSSKTNQQPSVSITPLPRGLPQTSAISLTGGAVSKLPSGVSPGMKPGQNPNATNKTSFVICEICDGYIKDLDQLRNHMQWIHKVKIHPKMIYNRPPLNCQKCQFRFFTDQGLERHLLGSHGLVTSSMQEAANQGKDAGRCPICGMVYQRKLLNHVSRDHNMTLKPAHLSYKCTVCTATFGMYKQFESHVYSAHSTVAKKAMDAKKQATSSGRGSIGGGGGGGGSSLLKPVKINDEITIIPQPATKSRNSGVQMELESHVID